MFEREIIIPLFERGQLISADGKIQKNEFLLPKCLFDVIADGLIRADEVYRQLPNIAEEEVPGFWVSGAQDVMKSFLGCSNRICLTKGKNNELGIKFFALMNALIETTELDDIAQRCYNIVIDRAAFLIVFNKTTGSLACLDGHSHHKSTTGALIALTTKEHLIDFVNVILDEFVPFASGMPVERENVYISCIYPKDPGHSSYGKDGKEQITRLNDHTKPAKILNGQSYNEYVKKLDITCNENGTQVRRVEKAG
uniref:Uncharacterized protein n=1 Tax=Panagrolaimus davidi TaxID=227884 RepID=A0A914QBU7_9BILA